jgi:4-amino-4-deoxy-L-arabinose transferase-like glycosyltransferase
VTFRAKAIASSPWFLFGVALLLRLVFVFFQGHRVPRAALAVVPFQNEVGSVAAALAKGEGFCCLFQQPTGPTAWLAPVYPFFLSVIFRTFGTFTVTSFYVAAVFNCVFSALVCLPLFHAALRIGNRTTALLSGWAWIIFPSGILIPFEWIWDTSLSCLLAACLLLATLLVAECPKQSHFLLYGLFCGFCFLTNPALAAVFPFLLGWLYFRLPTPRREGLTHLAAVVALAVLVCVPWTIRNAVQFHRVVPIRSDFPFELWMGNNPIYDEHSREVNRITRYEQVRLYAQLGETRYLEEKGRAAKEFIRAHPTLCLRLAANRAVALWMGTSSPWRDFLRTESLLEKSLFLWYALALLGTVAGLVALLRWRGDFFLLVAVYPLVFPLVYYFTQASLRLRHPCDPMVALLMAVAIAPSLKSKKHANCV